MGPKPFAHRSFFLRPFVPEGETASGILISHHKSIPAIFGRVTAVTASCLEVRVGDWVVFEPGRPIRLKWSRGVVYALREKDVLGIVTPPDGLPWFIQEQAATSENLALA